MQCIIIEKHYKQINTLIKSISAPTSANSAYLCLRPFNVKIACSISAQPSVNLLHANSAYLSLRPFLVKSTLYMFYKCATISKLSPCKLHCMHSSQPFHRSKYIFYWCVTLNQLIPCKLCTIHRLNYVTVLSVRHTQQTHSLQTLHIYVPVHSLC